MDYINIDENNIDCEHICCAMTEKAGENGVGAKKEWMRAQFQSGYTFKRLNARGKVFIEYVPAEHAAAPIAAPGYMFIGCFWVSGKFKAQGHGKKLLELCERDARSRGCVGLAAVAASKKRAFLSDGAFYKKNGFAVADIAAPDFELLYKPFSPDAPKPRFLPKAKDGTTELQGMVLYYSAGCPFAEKTARMLAQLAADAGESLALVQFASPAEAKNGPAVASNYSFYDDGRFVTNEMFAKAKFEAYIAARAR